MEITLLSEQNGQSLPIDKHEAIDRAARDNTSHPHQVLLDHSVLTML